jgi:site-specific DNA-methyltransferase (adenine-specific)
MNPYYQDDLVTIYHGDCREWIGAADREWLDVLVTDPPYGIGWAFHGGGQKTTMSGTRLHDGIEGDHDTSLRDAVLGELRHLPGAVFGSFRAPFPANVRQVLIYRKAPDAGLVGSTLGFRRDAEPIFLVGEWPRREDARSSIFESRTGPARQKAIEHPHSKPLDVLVPLLRACPPGTILDPFMGSGSTLVAAKSLGRRSIGIEIEERYCEIAAQRCSQEVLGLGA